MCGNIWKSASIRLIELRDSGESVKHLRFESTGDDKK